VWVIFDFKTLELLYVHIFMPNYPMIYCITDQTCRLTIQLYRVDSNLRRRFRETKNLSFWYLFFVQDLNLSKNLCLEVFLSPQLLGHSLLSLLVSLLCHSWKKKWNFPNFQPVESIVPYFERINSMQYSRMQNLITHIGLFFVDKPLSSFVRFITFACQWCKL